MFDRFRKDPAFLMMLAVIGFFAYVTYLLMRG